MPLRRIWSYLSALKWRKIEVEFFNATARKANSNGPAIYTNNLALAKDFVTDAIANCQV